MQYLLRASRLSIGCTDRILLPKPIGNESANANALNRLAPTRTARRQFRIVDIRRGETPAQTTAPAKRKKSKMIPFVRIAVATLFLTWSGVGLAQQPAMQTRPSGPATTTPSRSAAAPVTSEYSTEAEARAHCPSDLVVWANTKSKVYHFAGTRNYGKTKQGAYMCQKDSDSLGFRAAKNEKPPSR